MCLPGTGNMQQGDTLRGSVLAWISELVIGKGNEMPIIVLDSTQDPSLDLGMWPTFSVVFRSF